MSFTNTAGYRFYPTEEELLGFYLRHKLENTRTLDIERFIPVLDVYKYHPSDLQYMAGESNRRDPEQWFFFCPIQERELQGGRPARTTLSGYWKATGSPNYVFSSSNKTIGMKRTMVFYQGRAPTGTKTKWKMNEYKAFRHAVDGVPAEPPEMRLEFSLCRVYLRTATLRSFDRRPVNTAIIENRISLEASTSNGNGNPVVPHLYERNDSTGSSSSGDLCLRNNSEEEDFDWNLFNDIDMDFNLF